MKRPEINRKLMDQLVPSGMNDSGRLVGLLATTYEMQPDFIETDLFPTIFGLGAWDDRQYASRIALEKNLAEIETVVMLMDSRAYRGRPRTLRAEIHPISRSGPGILHAKVLILIYERIVKLIVGSANLTEPGYRRNREVAAVITASEKRPADATIILEAMQGFERLTRHHHYPKTSNLIEETKTRLQQWSANNSDGGRRLIWGGDEQPLWRQFIDCWPATETIEAIDIVSPFWSEENDRGPISQFIAELRQRGALEANAGLRLITEAAPSGASYQPRLPASFEQFDTRPLGVEGIALAADPRIPPEEIGVETELTGYRNLHAKVVLLEGQRTSLLYLGSANFTHHGWGFLHQPAQANVEAGLILRGTGKARESFRTLIPQTIGSPVTLNGSAADHITRLEVASPVPPWPVFLQAIWLSPSQEDENCLEMRISVTGAIPRDCWITHLPSDEADQSSGLIVLSNLSDMGETADRRVPLSQKAKNRLVREQEVLVKWTECPDGCRFPINVTAAARQKLPISSASGDPDEQKLLAYYQGKISWEDLFPEPTPNQSGPANGPPTVRQPNVDTSRIQSYIVRDFVEALSGINADLKTAAQSTRAGMELALTGSVSPAALARKIFEMAIQSKRTPTAAGFQLVEILGCLHRARSYDPPPKYREYWEQSVDQAIDQVNKMLTNLQGRFQDALPSGFHNYQQKLLEFHNVRSYKS